MMQTLTRTVPEDHSDYFYPLDPYRRVGNSYRPECACWASLTDFDLHSPGHPACVNP